MNKQLNVAVVGEALIDFLEQTDGSFKPYFGGSPFNVAIALSRQSLNSHYLSPISVDMLGRRIAKYANSEKVRTPANGLSTKNSSLALVTTDESGQAEYELYRQEIADLDIDAKTVIDYLPDSLQLFHTGSLALVPCMEQTLIEIFTYLNQNDVPISIDINVRKFAHTDCDHYFNSIKKLMQFAKIIKVSDEDISALTGNSDYLSFCRTLLANSEVALVAFTQGEKGATLLTQHHSVFVSAVKQDKVVDTVGAGDTFFAALIAYLVRHRLFDIDVLSKSCLLKMNHYAAIAASINVSRPGCDPPTQQQIEAFAKTYDYKI